MAQFAYDVFFHEQLSRLKREGRYRSFLNIRRVAGCFPRAQAIIGDAVREVIVWCSNDYLGMGQHPEVLSAMHAALDEFGAGAGGTRNISGTHRLVVALEEEIAALEGKEAALVFSSGYVANETALCAITSGLPGCIVFSDGDNHDSMIQGIRHGKAEKRIFRHNDPEHLEELLKEADPSLPKLIAFESVYSMDGDFSPIHKICDLAKRYNALTFLDETHGVGLYGEHGGGVAQQVGAAQKIDIIQGGLGKGIGVVGGFIAASRQLVDFVRSFGNGFIFTTTIPPVVAAGAVAAIRHLRASGRERKAIQDNAAALKGMLREARIPTLPSLSHIVPVIVGDPFKCKKMSEVLLEEFGLYLQPINFPTVPRGTERFRITPSAVHTHEMLADLTRGLDRVWDRFALPRVQHSFRQLERAASAVDSYPGAS